MNKPKITVNPIDIDKVAQNPGLLPYAHSVSSPPIVPTKEGVIKHQSLEAMAYQTDQQMDLLRKQMELLAEQAKAIQRRREVPERVASRNGSDQSTLNVPGKVRQKTNRIEVFHGASFGERPFFRT